MGDHRPGRTARRSRRTGRSKNESGVPDNPGATHGADIVLYDKAFDSDQVLTLILNHEMAHRLLETLTRDELKSFLDAAKWKAKRVGGARTYVAGRPESQFLRPNGKLSYQEDFADDVAAYIHQPNRLKAVSPELFLWMEKHLKPRLTKRSHE